MTTILEKLEKDFENMESTLASEEKVDYDDVLPVVEKMQHPLGECGTIIHIYYYILCCISLVMVYDLLNPIILFVSLLLVHITWSCMNILSIVYNN